MSKDPFKENISNYLKTVAENDKLFAVTLAKPNKNIDECIAYIYQEVRKTGRCGFEDAEIYQMAVHYYDEDEIKVSKTTRKPIVSHTADKPKDNIQKIKEEAIKNATTTQKQTSAPVSKSKNKKSVPVVQPSLFD